MENAWDIYNEARIEANKASAKFRSIQSDYRNMKIADAEFLAGKKAYDEAQRIFDTQEAKYLESINQVICDNAKCLQSRNPTPCTCSVPHNRTENCDCELFNAHCQPIEP
jgi:hypothetical protein